MYILIVIGLIITVFYVGVVESGAGNLINLIDTPSFLLLLFIVVPVLLAAGLGKDFLAAFRLALGKEKSVGLRERKRALEAVELFMKSTSYAGIFGVILQFVSCHALIEDSAWSVYLSVFLIPILYAFTINLLLLPVKSRLNLGIIEYMQDVETEEENSIKEE